MMNRVPSRDAPAFRAKPGASSAGCRAYAFNRPRVLQRQTAACSVDARHSGPRVSERVGLDVRLAFSPGCGP